MVVQQSLKNKKFSKEKMRYTLLALFSIFTLILILNQSSAIFYNQHNEFREDNHTVEIIANIINSKDDSFVGNNAGSFLTTFINPLTAFDLLFGKKQDGYLYQFSVKYDLYPSTFNTQVGKNMIQKCYINITTQKYYSTLSGQSVTPSISQSYKEVSTTDLKNQEFYLSLDSGDISRIKVDCYFTNSTERTLNIPATLFINSPTLECTLCKQYQWSKIQPALDKAQFLQEANIDNIDGIKSIFFIIFDFLIIMFWILTILLVIFSIALIFYLAFKIYKYIEGLVK